MLACMASPSGTPGKKQITHERIVDTAARAIRRAGFNGVGVADIMKEAGLTHGGFYAHFASRDALAGEALDRAGRDSAQRLAKSALLRRARGGSAFQAFVERYLSERTSRRSKAAARWRRWPRRCLGSRPR